MFGEVFGESFDNCGCTSCNGQCDVKIGIGKFAMDVGYLLLHRVADTSFIAETFISAFARGARKQVRLGYSDSPLCISPGEAPQILGARLKPAVASRIKESIRSLWLR